MHVPKPRITSTPPRAGTHIARLYQLLDIGTVEEVYPGKPPQSVRKIRLTFELPDETKVFRDGEPAKPMVISQEFSLSMGKKSNLRKFIEGMIGAALTDEEAYAFDPEDLVGKPCLLTIAHKIAKNGNTYANILSASPLMLNQEQPDQVNPSKIVTYEKWDQAFFDNLPDFIKDKMKTSDEYKARFGGAPVNASDEIPF